MGYNERGHSVAAENNEMEINKHEMKNNKTKT